jgi:hypothetical protein
VEGSRVADGQRISGPCLRRSSFITSQIYESGCDEFPVRQVPSGGQAASTLISNVWIFGKFSGVIVKNIFP